MRDDGELPWDPIWAYVLGEEDEEERRGFFGRRKRVVDEDDGILSLVLNPLAPPKVEDEDESRDDGSWLEGESSIASESIELMRQSLSATGDRDIKSITSKEKSTTSKDNKSTNTNGSSLFFMFNRREKEEPEDQWQWQLDPAILGVAPSAESGASGSRASSRSSSKRGKALGEESGSPAKMERRRSFLSMSRSRSDQDVATAEEERRSFLGMSRSRSEQSLASEKGARVARKETSGWWLGGGAADTDDEEEPDDSNWALFRLKDTGESSSPDKQSKSEPWDILGLASDDPAPKKKDRQCLSIGKSSGDQIKDVSALGSAEQRDDAAKKKERRGLMIGKPKGEQPKEPLGTESPKKKERRSLMIGKPKVDQTETSWSLGLASEESPKKKERRGLMIRKPKADQTESSWSLGQASEESPKKKERRGLIIRKPKSEEPNDTFFLATETEQRDESPEKERRGLIIRKPKSEEPNETFLALDMTQREDSPEKKRRGLMSGKPKVEQMDKSNYLDGESWFFSETSDDSMTKKQEKRAAKAIKKKEREDAPVKKKQESKVAKTSKKKEGRERSLWFSKKRHKTSNPIEHEDQSWLCSSVVDEEYLEKQDQRSAVKANKQQVDPPRDHLGRSSFFEGGGGDAISEKQDSKRAASTRPPKDQQEEQTQSWLFGGIADEELSKKHDTKSVAKRSKSKEQQEQEKSWLFGGSAGEEMSEKPKKKNGLKLLSKSKKQQQQKKKDHQQQSWLFGGTAGNEISEKQSKKSATNTSKQKLDATGWNWTQNSSMAVSGSDSTTPKRRGRFAMLGRKKPEPETEPSGWQLGKREPEVEPPGSKVGKKEPEPSSWQGAGMVAGAGMMAGAGMLVAGLHDWVGTDSSSEEDSMEEGPAAKEQAPKVQRGVPAIEPMVPEKNEGAPKTESLISTLLGSWEELEEEDQSSSETSTVESSTVGSSTVESSVTSNTDQNTNNSEVQYTEVRLAFQPGGGEDHSDNDTKEGETSPEEPHINPVDRLSIFCEEGSAGAETHLYTDDRSSDSDCEAKLDLVNEVDLLSQRSVDKNARDESIVDFDGLQSVPNQPHWKTMCCSIKDLSIEKQRISAESGIPLHELSPKELARIFPKVRKVPDNQKYGRFTALEDPRTFGDYSASLEADPNCAGPQSLFQYEYETGAHMFVSYNSFGDSCESVPMQVNSAPVPRPSNDSAASNRVIVQIEASTVSQTDCCIRRGQWWRNEPVPLPNAPGVDFVGKLYRIDAEASKRHGLVVGDRVISLVKWGGNARFLSVDPSKLVKVPEAVDPASAVCLAETYLTAFQILHQGQRNKARYRGCSLQGKAVLIIGSARTNLGRAIAQLAADAGAVRIYAIAKKKNYRELMAMGVSPLNGSSTSWMDSLVGDVDCVISLGGPIDPAFYPLLTSSGQATIVKTGTLDESSFETDPFFDKMNRRMKRQNRSKAFVYDLYAEWENNIECCKKDLQHIVELLANERIAPNLLDRISLNKVAKAHQLIDSKRLTGFIVCEPWLVGKSRAVCL